MRKFENKKHGHNKFWNIKHDTYMVTTSYGKIGTEGVTQIKKFSTSWQASDYVAQKIREKLNKGYVEKLPKPAKKAPMWNTLYETKGYSINKMWTKKPTKSDVQKWVAADVPWWAKNPYSNSSTITIEKI